ncbi:MAG TPA: HAD family hydrolase [Alphaproteobacteria bacterium]|nr:HAD family hydrolase [Alphaproteobacteria bacterium]
MPKTIAVFDFDDTLVKGDSFKPFLIFVAGWPASLLALADTLLLFVVRCWKNRHDPVVLDFRTFLKAEMMRRTLKGHRTDKLGPIHGKMLNWRTWNEEMKQALLDHKANGAHIVVASGGLDLYLRELLKDLPVDAVICTEVGVDGNVITGEMTSGNCVRERKAEMVADYMAQHGPFDVSWGYGNYPHDVPMLNLMQHRVLV